MYSFRLTKDSKDTPLYLELARRAHNESHFRGIEFSEEKVSVLVQKVLADRNRHCGMLAFWKDEPVGMAYCSVGEYVFGVGTFLTTVHVIYTRGDVRKKLSGGKVALGLLTGIETWSKARKSQQILIHVTSGVNPQATSRVLGRQKYRYLGNSFSKQVTDK